MSTCPSCGRDAGTNEICPHCGADLKRRVKVRTFGLIAIVVAVAGVAALLFFAARAPVPAVKVGDIVSTSNYAYVQTRRRGVARPQLQSRFPIDHVLGAR